MTTEPPFQGFLAMSVLLGVVGLLLSVLAAFTINDSEQHILQGSLAATGVGGVGVMLALAGRPAHRRRRLEIAAHWTTADEQAAWQRAAPAEPSDDDAEVRPDLVRLRRRSTRYEYLGGVCAVLGLGLMQVWLFVAHPFRFRTDPGPRMEYGDGVEVALDAGIWVFAAFVVGAVVLLVVGSFADSAVQRREQQILREALASPAAARPPQALLRRYAGRQSVLVAQALAFLAAVGTTFGWAVLSLGTGGMADIASLYGDADETFGGFVTQALVTLAGSVVVVAAAVVWDAVAAGRATSCGARWSSGGPSSPRRRETRETSVGRAGSWTTPTRPPEVSRYVDNVPGRY